MSESDSVLGIPLEASPFGQKNIYRHPKLVDDDNNTRLHHAAAKGQSETVVDYLENESPTVDVENYLGWTPLMMACRNGHLSTVQVLLQYRANATKKNKFGMNIFQISIASGNLQLVELILEHLLTGGISKRSLEFNFSPVSLAVLFQHQDILEFLIKKQFNVNLKTSVTGITSLMFAQAMENCNAITTLLQGKADTVVKNYLGHTSLDIAKIRLQMKQLYMPEQKMLVYANQTNPLNPGNKAATTEDQQNQFLKNLLQKNHSATLSQSQTSSHHIPCILLSPYHPNLTPTIFQYGSSLSLSPNFNQSMILRKSSNASPFCAPPAPNVSPITPLALTAPHQQIFFPPDFSPGQPQISPQIYSSSDVLNARFNGSAGMFLSPPVMNFLSPCM